MIKTATAETPKAVNLPSEFAGKKPVTVATGFAPYWQPEKGDTIFCVPKMIDFSDRAFIRVLCKNIGDVLVCHTGPKDDDDQAEEIVVHKGEDFTASWLATLPFEFGLKDQVPLMITCLEKTKNGKNPDGSPKMLWHFRYQTPDEKTAQSILAEKARSMAFGKRNPKKNPLYLYAFTPEGLKLSAPTPDMLNAANATPIDETPDAEH
jgi:hypothetical protein